jgi:hypothetical protein
MNADMVPNPGRPSALLGVHRRLGSEDDVTPEGDSGT